MSLQPQLVKLRVDSLRLRQLSCCHQDGDLDMYAVGHPSRMTEFIIFSSDI